MHAKERGARRGGAGVGGGGRGEIKREGDRGVYSIAAIQSYSQGGSEKIDERVGKSTHTLHARGHPYFALEHTLADASC